VALVMVLWLVVVLGIIGAGVVSATRDSARLAANARARVVARYAAESAVEVTLAEVSDSLGVLADSARRRDYLNALEPRSSTTDSVQLGDGRFQVAVMDASARLDVNAAPLENLERLFLLVGGGARGSATARAIRSYLEREGPRSLSPLRTLDELERVPDADRTTLQLAAPYLTVDSDGRINGSAASEPVLAAAFGELTDAPTRLVVIARGWMRGHPLTHEIQGVYAVARDRLVLVHWREQVR